MLASKPHIIVLAALGAHLVVLSLVEVHVPPFAEPGGGNDAHVTRDLGACIAAGGTLHLVRRHRSETAQLERLAGCRALARNRAIRAEDQVAKRSNRIARQAVGGRGAHDVA